MSWPQEKMIGVTQDDFGVEVVRQVTRQQTLDGGLRPNGHEDGGFNRAMRRVEEARARSGNGASGLDLKRYGGHWYLL
mgnify:CR=1 FL=1